MPRKRISESDPVTTVAHTSSVLVVEEDSDGWDPFKLMYGMHTANNGMDSSKVVHAFLMLVHVNVVILVVRTIGRG